MFERSGHSHDVGQSRIREDGVGVLAGISVSECSTLCAALRNESATLENCKATMYTMANPGDPSSTAVSYCYLLHTLGSCSAREFATAILSRRDTSRCDLPTPYDNPACIQLSPQGVGNLAALSYDDSKRVCAGGRLSPRLPLPHTSLEVFSMLG